MESKAYNSGYDYYTSGGTDQSENPYFPESPEYQDWNNGWADASQQELDAHMFEHFTDIC